MFARTLNSFGQLVQLDIIRVRSNLQDMFNLNLLMLISLQFEDVYGSENLILEAPRLRELKHWDYETDLRIKNLH